MPAAVCELAVRLYTPNLNNLGAKLPIVSGPHLKYSRFSETRAGDRARSALRGGPGSAVHLEFESIGERGATTSTGAPPDTKKRLTNLADLFNAENGTNGEANQDNYDWEGFLSVCGDGGK